MRFPNVNLTTKIRHFCLEIRGASAVEFGLVAIPFLALLLSIFETGFVYWTSAGLQVAVQDASRNLLTGVAQGASVSTADQFRTTYLCPTTGTRVLPSFIDCSKLIIDVRSYSTGSYTTFSTLDIADDFYASGTPRLFCPGRAGAITVVRVAYPMPVFLPTIVGGDQRDDQDAHGRALSGRAGHDGLHASAARHRGVPDGAVERRQLYGTERMLKIKPSPPALAALARRVARDLTCAASRRSSSR